MSIIDDYANFIQIMNNYIVKETIESIIKYLDPLTLLERTNDLERTIKSYNDCRTLIKKQIINKIFDRWPFLKKSDDQTIKIEIYVLDNDVESSRCVLDLRNLSTSHKRKNRNFDDTLIIWIVSYFDAGIEYLPESKVFILKRRIHTCYVREQIRDIVEVLSEN